MRRWLHARLDANEQAGWEYVALESRMEPTRRDRMWFLWLRVEHAILRAVTEGGALSWR